MRRRLLAAASLTILLAACGQDGSENQTVNTDSENNVAMAPGAPSQDLAALVGATPRLAELVKAAGMERVLAGKEPYTVLAPNEAALAKLPPATFQGLDQPQRKAELTALLRGHILPGTILAADLARAVESGDGKATVATMTGEPLTVTRDGNSFRITAADGAAARITGTEQPARNGVVHEIDTVLTGTT